MFIYDISTQQSWSQMFSLPTSFGVFASLMIDRWIVATGAKIGDSNNYMYLIQSVKTKKTYFQIYNIKKQLKQLKQLKQHNV